MKDIKDVAYSQYARRLDETDKFNEDEGYELIFLLEVLERHFTDLLKLNGCVFLNDVYESLGLSRIQEYDNVGWIYNEENPIGDNFVDFGVHGPFMCICGIDKDNMVLDFNVDGVIRY